MIAMLKRVYSSLWVQPVHTHAFEREICISSLQRMQFIVMVGVIIQVSFIIPHVMLRTHLPLIQRILTDLIAIPVLCVASLILWRERRHMIRDTERSYSLVASILTVCILLFSIVLTLHNPSGDNSYLAYLLPLIILMTFIPNKPLHTLCTTLSCHIVLVCGILILSPKNSLRLTEAMNLTSIYLLLLVAHRLQYTLRVNAFEREQDTDAANQELKRANAQLILLNSQLSEVNAQLYTLSHYDELTGVPNRQSLMLRFNDLMMQNEPLGIFILDIDHFKWYNDSYGHVQGDVCLRQVAECLRHTLSLHNGFFGRYGGEEFIAILPHADVQALRQVARAMLRDVYALQLPHMASDVAPVVTISGGGLLLMTHDGLRIEHAITSVDRLLYQSKNNGRNCMYILPKLLEIYPDQIDAGLSPQQWECVRQ